MTTVVFDIETVSLPWLEIDPMLREKLTRYAEDHEDFLRRKKGGSLSPYAGRVVVIGIVVVLIAVVAWELRTRWFHR